MRRINEIRSTSILFNEKVQEINLNKWELEIIFVVLPHFNTQPQPSLRKLAWIIKQKINLLNDLVYQVIAETSIALVSLRFGNTVMHGRKPVIYVIDWRVAAVLVRVFLEFNAGRRSVVQTHSSFHFSIWPLMLLLFVVEFATYQSETGNCRNETYN